MNDRECVELLQWALPLLGLRYRGFKNVRRQVCRRLSARVRELGLDARGYRQLLEDDLSERNVLDALCFVTISRFYRDRQVYDLLASTLVPELLARQCSSASEKDRTLRIWSAGCASGEEPYTVAMLWHFELAKLFPDRAIEIIATDSNDEVLARAHRGAYEPSSLVELPVSWRDQAFEARGDNPPLYFVRDAIKKCITFVRDDVRRFTPDAPLHIVLCRNLAFTYFDETAQRAFIARISERLVSNGLLVVGGHESIPDGSHALEAHPTARHVFFLRGR